MRPLALALAACCAASAAAAHELPVRLSDGASWTMTVQRDRERVRQGQAPQALHSQSVSRLDWKGSGTGGVLTVTPQSATASSRDGPEVDAQTLLKQPIVLEVDEALSPVSIVNWAEVRQALDQAIGERVTDSKVRPAMQNMISGLPPDQAAPVLMREMGLASLGQGLALEVGEDFPYADQLPNPLGGPPVAASGRFHLESYDEKAGRAVVLWNNAFDQASASESLRKSMELLAKQIAPDKAAEAMKFFEGAKVDRQDACRHEIDIPTGLAVRAVCSSTISISASGQSARNVDRWTISQTLPKTNP